jgi:ATP-dependent DNA ligase
MRKQLSADSGRWKGGAVPAEAEVVPEDSFPRLHLPLQVPFAPMEAKSVETIPTGDGWQYEPKWDGFRCLAFRDGKQVVLQSKAGQPLARYFPELVAALLQVTPERFVLDGEIVIVRDGRLSFDDLLMRIHPAKSRIDKLSKLTPCTLMVFDLLVDTDGSLLIERPLRERRVGLERFYAHSGKSPLLKLSAATSEAAAARRWMTELAESGCDGVVAKALDDPYLSGERSMRKIKRIRSADCVVGGFRLASKGGMVGSLLLGLYGEDGLLHHVGYTSSFTQKQRAELMAILKPHLGGEGFTGNAPGGPSRWSTERSGQWERLQPRLVIEVSYDHFSGERFRHGTKFLRWRPDKHLGSCTFQQVRGNGVRGGTIENLLVA